MSGLALISINVGNGVRTASEWKEDIKVSLEMQAITKANTVCYFWNEKVPTMQQQFLILRGKHM